MDGVGRIGAVSLPALGAGTARRGAGGFSLGAAPARAAPLAAGSPAELAGALLQQQEEDGPTRDGRARRQGVAVLAALAELQRALLGDALDPALPERLAGMAASIPPAQDPALHAALRMVAQRARIELARLEIGGTRNRSAHDRSD